ncbi:hypothetical protein [Polymorphospora sp. NPDC050346]|uniref:hypothetical protein n=1 Tax=Polymorphospora sp. NPDC050346 TaxID=3155780 RepID=UPI003409C35B
MLDNLIHSGDIPVTVGLFVDPGVLADTQNPKNRNIEYDAFDDRLVTFLLTEIIPQVTQRYSITDAPTDGVSVVAAATGTAPSPPRGNARTSSGERSASCPASCRCPPATPTRT